MNNEDLSGLSKRTQHVYEKNATRFAHERPKKLVEKPWLERLRKLIPANGKVLDLGCGAGEPIASYLIRHDYRVVGLDTSPTMIRLAQENLPTGDWRLGDIRTFDFPEQFDCIIGWNSFFHLTREEQRSALPSIARHLRPNGALLLTVGPHDGEAAGFVGDDPVYHASLSQGEYCRILSSLKLNVRDFVPEDPTCYGMTILVAQMSDK